MKLSVVALVSIFFIAAVSPAFGLARPDVEFKVFQFPKDKVPKIDGNTDDWAIVPDSYAIGTDQLKDTVKFTPNDKNDLDVKVKVGWVKGLNQLFFLYEAYDNYWDFKSTGLHNDIFEVHVDGDLSGGSFLPAAGMSDWEGYLFQGVYSQNYHICTPAEGKAWCYVWGCQPWAAELPWANAAYSYSFKHGESGNLILEFCITPFDYAPYAAPEKAIPSTLEENKIIGLSWAVLDYDNENASGYDGFYNLSWNTRMDSNASQLCAFRLMPLETQFHKPIEADWSFKVVDMVQCLVQFKDLSYGNITSWKWDFGDGTTSTEQNPTHKYSQPEIYNIVVLNVEGPDGTARMSKVWDVAVGGASTSVGDTEKPGQFSLAQNFPNPFNPVTTISFTIPRKNHVNLAIYNVAGEKVADLADKDFPAGKNSVTWNARGFASGVYFTRISVGGFTDTMKLVLLK